MMMMAKNGTFIKIAIDENKNSRKFYSEEHTSRVKKRERENEPTKFSHRNWGARQSPRVHVYVGESMWLRYLIQFDIEKTTIK